MYGDLEVIEKRLTLSTTIFIGIKKIFGLQDIIILNESTHS